VVEGDRVYLISARSERPASRNPGEIVWKTRLEYDNGQHGTGGSPVIYEDL
jgi:hypothetical protein